MKTYARALVAAAVGLSAVVAGVVWAGIPVTSPGEQACEKPDRSVELYAGNLPGGRIGYGLAPESVSVPGPTIEMTEGECIALTLNNQADRKAGVHPHGVDYTVASDGTPINKGCVRPGRSKTYVLSSHAPQQRPDGSIDAGNAGYWHYHDHCQGTPHGTGGIAKGLFGALVVRRAGDPLPDREPIVLVMNQTTFNLTKAPHTPIPVARLGERVEFIVIGHGDLFHTFHLHGHRWVDNRTGLAPAVESDEALIDNKVVGPADSFGFQVIAGEHVGPGAWMYHCHVQGHSDMGMSGLFVVAEADGTIGRQTQAAIDKWKRLEASHH